MWLPVAGFVRQWLLWCFESRARAAVARAAILIAATSSKCVSEIKAFNWNEIMNGNQGDHVTFVSTWRRSKQRLSFCRTFQPFIQHPDAAHSDRRTPKHRRHTS